MKVLITGGCGFLGSNLAASYLEEGVAAFTGPFLAIYTIPLLIFHRLRRRRLPIQPLWLGLPVLLSSL
ncbi:hypothetical protein [Synechococcus sp. BA-132 BA5]|uniref:hypothetical protein n=1 Tax=Synechococcus sp. BA-132 BA5 TaxID=3110252 RepID=UPI002B1EE0CA|nr:hypothetical protein [Synechococcus sp. BA-132 BA5]MEA5416258.1 hypothetical protein [Synechococcus sp. BA-132 BA5]